MPQTAGFFDGARRRLWGTVGHRRSRKPFPFLQAAMLGRGNSVASESHLESQVAAAEEQLCALHVVGAHINLLL